MTQRGALDAPASDALTGPVEFAAGPFLPPNSNPLSNPSIPIFRPTDASLAINQVRHEGVRGGLSTGFESLDQFITLKPGFPVYVAGSPYAGKSLFAKQLLVNLSRLHGWKHCVYLGEDGSVADLTVDLVEMYVGKSARMLNDDGSSNPHAMSEAEFISAVTWVDTHFFMCDPDAMNIPSFNLAMFYEWVAATEREHGVKFDTTVIDPWNDVEMDIMGKGGREDLFLADALKLVRDTSRINNRIDILITHVTAPQTMYTSGSGRRYSAPAEPTGWAGGQTWHRRSFTMIMVWRPPAPDTIKMGRREIQTARGETWIMIQKAKPRGVGKLGTCRLWFDTAINQYTETPPSE